MQDGERLAGGYYGGRLQGQAAGGEDHYIRARSTAHHDDQ